MTPPPGPLSGQVAVVTGGARGLGLGIARRLARDGARVAVWDLDLAPLAEAGWRPGLACTVDVTSPEAVAAALARTEAGLGPIGILVNNAGISGPIAHGWDYPPDAWERVLAVNLGGVFHGCRAVLPGMLARASGRIVNMASLAGKEGTPRICAYAAAKAGVIALTKSLARETAGRGVLVNCVAPAMAETELLQGMTPDFIAEARGRIPLGRLAQVEEVAAMVAWVAGPECSFTTGFTFDLSGGRASF
ncbi:SDR family oxidoreductase [Roseomonas sp. OT10]|uniref:SDR family NAD(P)-dependent oxidoreductase n=1 Tax=Roseomonas cutis TaxID=2897332 RepID=UPI001E5F9978|nr:SDR family NAD(P)-dependent oxidoreductase [Roseomonas sp. OT10]UFN47153.1 SDR family oxidoreductase [Roseomonas sp. OT10]